MDLADQKITRAKECSMITVNYFWPLLLLPLPLLIIYLLPAKEMSVSYALKVPFFHHLQSVTIGQNFKGSKNKSYLLWLLWLCLILALCDPKWVGKPMPLTKEGRNIFLALDLSGSMQATDIEINGRPVTRLTVVKSAAEAFINKRKLDRLGLILFGTRAYLQTPLTFDHKTLLHMLNDATIGLAGEQTAIGDAIALAIKNLKKTPENSRVLILLTDGVSNADNIEPLAAAKIAKQFKVKIYTIGLGTSSLAVPAGFNAQMYSGTQLLDEKTLKEIAHMTGGEYYRARDFQQLNSIYQQINQLETTKSKANNYRPEKLYYYFPLAVAFLCLLVLGFPRRQNYV
jgi:Ca-activated chloride channel family protein